MNLAGFKDVTLHRPGVVAVGSFSIPIPPTWPSKDPTEVASYVAIFDYIDSLRTPIIQVDVVVNPAGAATVVRSGVFTNAVWLEIAGGQNGVTAYVAITVTLSNGERYLGVVALPIVATAPAIILTDEITINGLAVTVGGQTVGILAELPITVEGSPITVSGVPITLEA